MALDEQDKQWIQENVTQQIIAAEERIISALKAFVSERSEQVETRLLTAFQQWASPMEARMRTHAAAIKAIDAEMEYHEDRLKRLEGRSPAQ